MGVKFGLSHKGRIVAAVLENRYMGKIFGSNRDGVR
jgi:hypothetical protein